MTMKLFAGGALAAYANKSAKSDERANMPRAALPTFRKHLQTAYRL